jgi:hypothetical protein
VTTRKELDAFIQLHYTLYKGNAYDAPNLYIDELQTLSREKNPAFDFCEAEYFLAYKEGRVAGRVAAIINRRYNEQWQRPCVRFGWLDMENDIIEGAETTVSWMTPLPDDTPVSRLSIPGAHDAATSSITSWPMWTKPQELDIAALWNAGVRAFDLR